MRDPLNETDAIALPAFAGSADVQHEKPAVVPGVANWHVRAAPNSAPEKRYRAGCYRKWVGFGGVATSSGDLANQTVKARLIGSRRIAVAVQFLYWLSSIKGFGYSAHE